ncbi:zinc finger CCCH domain-containing protein 34-like [Malania oleifera]|uniref:zinc finger CCCH domain-containing protein 34-like n=1 Tax=Malania oleifera TaxID=397392 RepID=UPI0025ADCEB5|nr:zinc finger CCCH domain-containing protein 34-like [Malania oleifera]
MEDELQKRNTDCVYFLASPLTCKKGIDCEYRHSDIARLNPRDCWYWLAGNCLNPTCAFRHPPLDGHSEGSLESAAAPSQQSSATTNKTNVPCYFYFNGFCNKGDQCSFLHGPDGSTAWKSVKTTSAGADAPSLDNKTSVGSDIRHVPNETHPNLSETAQKAASEIQFQPNDVHQKSVPNKVVKQSAYPQTSVSESEEAAPIKSESLPPEGGLIESGSLICSDQSSDEQVDGHVEPEERWESSPGFDVLVDNRSDDMGYQDDPEYAVALEREGREVNDHFLRYDFEDRVEYDSIYSDAEILCEHRIYDSYDRLDYDHRSEYGQVPRRMRQRIADPILSRKRKLLPVGMAENGRNGVDLREHLRKHRMIDGHPVNRFSRRNDSPRLIGRNRERSRRHGAGQRLHGRLASEVGRNMIGSFGEKESVSNGVNRQDRLRRLRLNRPRHHFEEKRQAKMQFVPSEVSREPPTRERRYTSESSSFTGPKSLAQIKEEKRKAMESGDCFGVRADPSRMSVADFQGPKPLSEILKEKGKLGLDEEDNIC